jgi:hypothetical protein
MRLIREELMYRKIARNCFVVGLTLCLWGAFVTGCSRMKSKYREVVVEFSNALRIDSKFADARYQLGLCDLQRKDEIREGIADLG